MLPKLANIECWTRVFFYAVCDCSEEWHVYCCLIEATLWPIDCDFIPQIHCQDFFWTTQRSRQGRSWRTPEDHGACADRHRYVSSFSFADSLPNVKFVFLNFTFFRRHVHGVLLELQVPKNCLESVWVVGKSINISHIWEIRQIEFATFGRHIL